MTAFQAYWIGWLLGAIVGGAFGAAAAFRLILSVKGRQ